MRTSRSRSARTIGRTDVTASRVPIGRTLARLVVSQMRVIFVEPSFPRNQREFVRALASVGAEVIGIGESPEEFLDDELRGWMRHYHQVGSVVDVGAMTDAVRWIQDQVWVDRLESTIEAHILPVAAGARGVHHSRDVAAHGLAVPRQAVHEGRRSAPRGADCRVHRAPTTPTRSGTSPRRSGSR